MNPNEITFFSVFLILIIGVLMLDLGVFDRRSHEVPFKEALIWTGVWVFLSFAFYMLLRTHGDLIHGLDTIEAIKAQVAQYKHPIEIDGLNYEQALQLYRQNLSLEYLTGYLIEYALSVDNVFVMILIFLAFKVQKMYYKRVLFWGILGAVIMRFLFIFLSASLIQRFEWIMYIFGAFLVFTGIKMFLARNQKEKIDAEAHPMVKLASRFLPVYPHFFRQHFWFRKPPTNKLYFTPLFLVLLVIEFTDVVFAVDSVPAIFSVTLDPYIVFFSNIFAILGLRSLFFVVVNVISLFHYLKHGLSILLAFIGMKMLLKEPLHDIGFTTAHSLYVVVGILALSILASLIFPSKQKRLEKAHLIASLKK
jgi:tellurite resistance protein TerC